MKFWQEVREGDLVKVSELELNKSPFPHPYSTGKIYIVGGKYHGHAECVGVTRDDLGRENGSRPALFEKVDLGSFDNWWFSYYPQEYGQNAEFRNIVEKHARAAWDAARKES